MSLGMQSPRAKANRADPFDIWWNNTRFHTTGPWKPIHDLLHKLFERGATLRQIQDIDLLGGCLIIGDMWTFDSDKNNSSMRPKRDHHASRPFALLLPNDAVLEAEIEKLKAKKKGYQKLLMHAVELGEKAIHEIARKYQTVPLLPALLEFHVPDLIQHALSRRGSKLDSWGSFFLLPVTEYMKQALGRPYYRVAYDLLQVYRGRGLSRQFKRSEHAKGKSKAIDRIKKLKRLHPLWAGALVPLFLQLQLNRDGITEYRASGRAYLAQKRRIEPITFMVNRYLQPLGL